MKWTGTEEELLKFINKLNQKHKMIIIKGTHSFSKGLRVNRICSTNSEFEAHINATKDLLVKHEYEKNFG